MLTNFRELEVWIRSRKLCVRLYKETAAFPDTEKYGLTSQIRRAAVSIPSNVAEGSGRTTYRDFSSFISMSLGSSYEVETQILIAYEVDYLSKEVFDELSTELTEIQKMLTGYKIFLREKIRRVLL